MSRRFVSGWRGVLILIVVEVLVIAGLLVAGTRSIPVRTFALRVPEGGTVGVAHASQRVCEGPIQVPSASRGIGIFGTGSANNRALEAIAMDPNGRTLAHGRVTPDPSRSEHFIPLDHWLPVGGLVRICVGAIGGSFSLFGSSAVVPGVRTTGVAHAEQFALVLTRPGTFLGSLSTAFTRAAIFRPSWVGAWTFWLLLALLGCALPLAGIAVTRALADDEPHES